MRSLTHKELDNIIGHEIMGWSKIDNDPPVDGSIGAYKVDAEQFSPTTNLLHTLRVIAKLREQGIVLECISQMGIGTDDYTCIFFIAKEFASYSTFDPDLLTSICRCAILAYRELTGKNE